MPHNQPRRTRQIIICKCYVRCVSMDLYGDYIGIFCGNLFSLILTSYISFSDAETQLSFLQLAQKTTCRRVRAIFCGHLMSESEMYTAIGTNW